MKNADADIKLPEFFENLAKKSADILGDLKQNYEPVPLINKYIVEVRDNANEISQLMEQLDEK